MKRFAVAAIALSLLGTSVAMADGHHGWDHRGDYRGDHREWHGDGRYHDADRWREHRDWEARHDWRGYHDWRGERFHDDDYFRHGYRFGHLWHRGERLSPAYYAPSYVVRDYYTYQLPPPPYGCRWVRVDGNVVLAAIATGVVLDVVYNVF
jgi:Ni/Co efflux regulator RcnB